MIQSLLFVSGLSTFLQSLFGTRLPTVVVGSFTYLIPTISIIQAKRYSSYTDPYEVHHRIFAISSFPTSLNCLADLVHMGDFLRGSLIQLEGYKVP